MQQKNQNAIEELKQKIVGTERQWRDKMDEALESKNK